MADFGYNALMDMGADAGFVDWIKQQNIDPTNLTSSNFDALKADYGNFLSGTDSSSGGLVGGINETLGTNMTGSDLLKGTMGIGQLGLGALSYLDQKKTAKKQRGLMDQQMQQNKFLLDQARGRQADIGKSFGGSGLAASSV
jgi:hypothetical protein